MQLGGEEGNRWGREALRGLTIMLTSIITVFRIVKMKPKGLKIKKFKKNHRRKPKQEKLI